MGRKLLIVASERYGDYVKEIAESMGCFEAISFVDNDREGAIGKWEEVETFYPEYNCAIAVWHVNILGANMQLHYQREQLLCICQ